MVGIPIDVLDRLLGSIDPHLGWPCELASAVDDAGFQHAWSELGAIIEPRDALQEIIGVVGHVTRTGHTVSEIERAFDIAEMLMVIPQPRHQKATMRVDDLGVRGWLYVGVGRHAHDAITAHQHADSGGDAEVARIEQARIADYEIAFRNVRQFVSETSGPRVVGFLLNCLQLRNRRFVLSWDNREPARYGRRRVAIVVEPDRLRGKTEPSDAILNQFDLTGYTVDTDLARLLDTRFACRQQ